MDTASTFKLGVFPYTNDPQNTNGNGVERPVLVARRRQPPGLLDRPARRHGRRRRRTRPASRSRRARPGSAATRRRPPTTRTRAAATTSRSRSRWRSCPAAVDPDRIGPEHHAVRQRQQRGGGHDDAAPHRRGQTRARLVGVRQRAVGPVAAGATRRSPATRRRPTGRRRRAPPNVSSPNLNGVDSPQTIAQSARDGVPISGRDPAPRDDRIATCERRRSTATRSTFDAPRERARPRARSSSGRARRATSRSG